MVLDNKSLANIARCVLDSADKTNRARFLSSAPWQEAAVNDRRISYLLEQTAAQRRPARDAALLLDDTLCAHVGSLFAYVARHYNHGDGTYPLAHNPVTSHYVSGAVRFPVDLRRERRDAEVTRWADFVRQHFPGQALPATKKERAKRHKAVDPVRLTDPAFRALHDQFQTKLALGIALVDRAVARQLPCGVVLMDRWYLAEEVVAALAARKKDWGSRRKRNRNLETASFVRKDAAGQPLALPGPHLQVQALVPLIPRSAYRAVTGGDQTYWCCTLTVRLPSLGKVRLGISFDNADLTGNYARLVTNRTDWSAQKVSAT